MAINPKPQEISKEVKNKYLLDLRINVFKILNHYNSGLESDSLEKKLRQKLDTSWTSAVFKCAKFHLFMLEHLKDIVEVEMKFTHNGGFKYIFYLKNSRFKNSRTNLKFAHKINSLVYSTTHPGNSHFEG